MRYTKIMVKLFCLFVFCGRISFVVEDVTFDPVSHTRFYRSRACPHCQVPIFFNWLENIHFPRKVTQVFYVIIKTELYCWAGLIMQVDICVTVTMLSWSPINSLLLGDSSPHQAPLLESFTITATSKSNFFFFDRGLFIFTGLSEILQRKNYHSHRRTLWRNTLLKSLGSNYLTCFPTSTRGNFSLRVTCSASKLAWSHGFINSLVTCSRCRWLWRSWYGVYSFGEHEILWVEWQLMIFALPHY